MQNVSKLIKRDQEIVGDLQEPTFGDEKIGAEFEPKRSHKDSKPRLDLPKTSEFKTVKVAETLTKIDDSMDILDMPNPFRSLGSRSALTDLNNLMEQCPQPQPPLTKRNLLSLQLNDEQVRVMSQQVGKMKTGMERLQEIAQRFHCTDKFKEDIDFLVANVQTAIRKSEEDRKSQTSSSKEAE